MTFQEWKAKYARYSEIAHRIRVMRNQRARQVCRDAGLDPNLLGIHPHNAMCGWHAGRPWPGVDYSKVRLCMRLLNSEFDAHRIVDEWTNRVWPSVIIKE